MLECGLNGMQHETEVNNLGIQGLRNLGIKNRNYSLYLIPKFLNLQFLNYDDFQSAIRN